MGLHRIAVAWAVCCGWGVLALSGLWLARKAISGPPPFRLMAAALARYVNRSHGKRQRGRAGIRTRILNPHVALDDGALFGHKIWLGSVPLAVRT
jgi:hypothetical protein